ncbi:argininosuccinate lyase [Chthonomonas calidirosea]|uniref:argininosuccinate lyase n=1 Tax=Chthonomonas calidirosea TaxID=454171 RepID=UPI0006DD5448|nr:argininosuccinate lyase [Chthonomonas calidirosea]CEK17668.1 argininosuccinate lyase [Chthonomonas calidirosea]CEK17669.1 argininosuccinate lyase [Chthonomonas calidirosea]
MRKLWGGRFEGETDALIAQLNSSLPFDRRLWRQDIQGSIAHATMLGATGILPQEEAMKIVEGLKALEQELAEGRVALPEDAEDVHTAIESLLYERIGDVAGKLHTARSRNDQVTTDLRLYLRDVCDRLTEEIREFQQTLVALAEREIQTVLPGFTHLQHAQPISLAHHLLAYFWMLDRDRERLHDCRKRLNRLPLGAGALAGTSFPIDRRRVAELLGFDAVLPNSLDAVSDRDFAVEFLSAAAILGMHLSRLAEEIILWNSPEFGFVELDDSVTTGSSIMPQKKNPDVAELVRGKTGRLYGNLLALLTVLKGIPLAYNKDLQEDKEPLFDTVDTLLLILPALRRTLQTARFRAERMEAVLEGDFSTATDLADYLARRGMPFREAHEIVGRIVRYCLEKGIKLEALDVATLKTFSPLFDSEVLALLTPRASMASRTSEGGTAPDAVRAQLAYAKQKLAEPH